MSNVVSNLISEDTDQQDIYDVISIADEVSESTLSEPHIQQALRELESVWMAHHNHYARVLETLMDRVNAARVIV